MPLPKDTTRDSPWLGIGPFFGEQTYFANKRWADNLHLPLSHNGCFASSGCYDRRETHWAAASSFAAGVILSEAKNLRRNRGEHRDPSLRSG